MGPSTLFFSNSFAKLLYFRTFLLLFASAVAFLLAFCNLLMFFSVDAAFRNAPGSISNALHRTVLKFAPIANWQAASETAVSIVFLPTKMAFGAIFQILLWNDSLVF